MLLLEEKGPHKTRDALGNLALSCWDREKYGGVVSKRPCRRSNTCHTTILQLRKHWGNMSITCCCQETSSCTSKHFVFQFSVLWCGLSINIWLYNFTVLYQMIHCVQTLESLWQWTSANRQFNKSLLRSAANSSQELENRLCNIHYPNNCHSWWHIWVGFRCEIKFQATNIWSWSILYITLLNVF